jgi:hypothetical protein
VYSLSRIILKIFIWSANHKFYIQFLRQLGLQSFKITLYFALNKLSTEKVLSITRLENVLQVLAFVTPLLHKPCLHLQNGIF